MTRVLAAVFAFAFAASPISATAAEPAPAPASHALPRSLVFAVQYSERSEHRIATSGLANADGTGTTSTPSSATDRTQDLSGNDGVVKVDVVAVPPDGIVVDIAEGLAGRLGQPVRIGVAMDGKLLYDPARTNLSAAEVAILQLFNRALVTEHDADGATWTAVHDGPGIKDRTEYRIASSEPGPVLHIDVQRTLSAAVAGRPVDLLETGSLRYDEVKTIPLDGSLRGHRTTHQTGQVDTVDSTLTFRLVSDSWHPKGAAALPE
jgi:hypothetical protein